MKRLILFIAVMLGCALLAGPGQQMLLGVKVAGGVTVPTPVYQWDFNENTGTTATDSIASSVLNLFPPDSTWGAAHTGASSIAFSGSGDPYITGTDVFDALSTGPFSLSFWVNPTTLPTTSVFFFTGLGYQTSGVYAVIEDTGVLTFITNQLGANQSTATASSAIGTSSWQHICITRNGAVVKIYVNGSDATSSSSSHVDPATGNGTMRLGAYNTILPYNGLIDQFYMYDSALTAPQVAQLYTNTQ